MFYNNLAYEASAGSGKTFMLVVRYLSLLFKGAKPSKILALTFTNKAANEMQERIISTLEDLQNRDELNEISKVTDISREQILEQKDEILREFLSSNTKIMTIDSFFTQILRKFSLYASLMPDFSTFNAQHEVKLLSRFLKEVSVSNKTQTLINLSMESQKRLGSIFLLLEDFYEKKHQLQHKKFLKRSTDAYENKALSALFELKKIIDACPSASQTLKNAVDVNTFIELTKKSWVVKDTLNYRTFSKCFVPEMNDILTTIQDSLRDYYKAREGNFFYALNELSSIYEKSKQAIYKNDSELSFTDVTLLVHYLLKERVDSEFLYFRLDSEIEHMLLDEFQDTSVLQYEILKPLIDEIVSGEGVFNDGSFFFVGDVKQSIYRFRGGVSALFSTVQKECHTKVEALLTNYRSKSNVIEFVNNTFINKIKNYQNQQSRVNNLGGYVEVLYRDDILETTLETIKKLYELGVDQNKIAILCATNGDGKTIKDFLELNSISVVTETTTQLINQKSIRAILEYFKYLYFKEDIYKYNFFTLISSTVEDIEFVDFKYNKIVDIVIKMVKKYKLFTDDFDILRLLKVIENYQDIEAFLFEYERLDTTAAASEANGIRVLTTHKSKGLEYDNVIVIDRLKKAPPSRDTIIYEYDGIDLKNIYLRIKNRELLDQGYENALLKEKALVYEDKLNALYVAFTRAKENLFIIQKSKNSMFEILDLQPINYGELLEVKIEILKVERKLSTIKYKDLYYGTQSDILALEDDTKEDIKSQNFGIALHYILEMLNDFNLDSITKAYNMMLNKYGHILDNDEILDIKNRVKMLLEDKLFLELSDGKYFKEQGVKYNKTLKYIDLLVQKKDKYIVIDYKSSLLFETKHKKQVKSYINIINNITKTNVEGYICYILEDKIKIKKI